MNANGMEIGEHHISPMTKTPSSSSKQLCASASSVTQSPAVDKDHPCWIRFNSPLPLAPNPHKPFLSA